MKIDYIRSFWLFGAPTTGECDVVLDSFRVPGEGSTAITAGFLFGRNVGCSVRERSGVNVDGPAAKGGSEPHFEVGGRDWPKRVVII